MRALVIVPEAGSEPMLVGDALRRRGFELDEVLMPAPLDTDIDHDLVVVMGSTSSVYDDTVAWIEPVLALLRSATDGDVPVLGVCFGGQALATALGGTVVRAERPQVGWYPLQPDEQSGLPPGPWFQWHYDRIEPPADADVLARDDLCVQAFTVGRNLGLQFHPEVTAAHVARWLEIGGNAELAKLGIDGNALLDESRRIEPDATTRAHRLVDWFLDDVAKL